MSNLNKIELQRWKKDNGDNTHIINYNLNLNSNVIDLGGYTGIWAEAIYKKYKSNIFILEPVPQFYKILYEKFSNNPKIHLLNAGVATENKIDTIFINKDASSINSTKGIPIEVEFITLDTALSKWNLEEIDLIQINIEGEEYSILEDLIKKNLLRKFKNFQIQFHTMSKNFKDRREKIREELLNNNFELIFDYPFVWEGWARR